MMKGWKEVSLKQYTTKIGSGVTPKGGSSVYIENGVSLFRSQNIYNGSFSTNGLVFIDNKTADKMKGVEVLEGDVLINITGDSVARCCYAPKLFLPGRVNQHVAIIRTISEQLDSKFLMYYLISPFMQKTLLGFASGAGATRNALTKSGLENLKIHLPQLPTQRKIASILSAYDDLIENNLKRIKLLEEKAQLTYEEWFVKMRFPGYETAKFDEETGLPEGWVNIRFGDFVKTSSGGTPSRKKEIEYYEGGTIPWIRTGELKNFMLINSEEFITPAGLKGSSAKLFPKNTVLLAMYGNTIGETSFVTFEASTNQACCGFLVEEKSYLSYFIHQYLLYNKEQILSHRMGAAQENISQSIIQNIKINFPSQNLLIEFEKLVAQDYKMIEILLNQNHLLKEARDILLPRLMSGMIDVEEIAIQNKDPKELQKA